MVRVEVSNIPKLRRIDKTERIFIAQLKARGYSNGEIAKTLERSVSTIGREIKRNSFKENIYEPLHANTMCLTKRKLAWEAKHPLKNKWVYAYVLDKLRCGWSPEQISGRLKLEYPDDEDKCISHESIYTFIYKGKNKEKRYWEYLRRKQARRRKKFGRKSQRVRIPDRVSIHLRPEVIDKRSEIGHWEGDSLVGKNHTSGLHTAYERVSSLIKIEKMKRLNADESIKAQLRIYSVLPRVLRKSTTVDNGSEHVKHNLLKKVLGIKTFFADPYSAWQRGGNENGNLWIRYYFPKGTDFNTIPDEDLKDVEWELNTRPRKRLQYETPMEVFTKYL